MTFICTKSQVRKIGSKLRHGTTLDEKDESLFTDFRMGHLPIVIESFHIADSCLPKDIEVGARLKRRKTIASKLATREPTMNLTEMSDIAGCRLIFNSMNQLKSFRDCISNKMSHAFTRKDNDTFDYIANPKPKTGYRSIHEVFEERNDDSVIHPKIEIQYRTAVQHSWSTALEIWDNVTGHSAKFGKELPEVQNLFRLLSELLWRFLDGKDAKPTIKMSNKDLFGSIAALESQYSVLHTLRDTTEKGFALTGAPIKPISENDAFYILRRTLSDRLIVSTTQQQSIPDEVFKNEIGAHELDPLVVMARNYKMYNNYLNDAKRFLQYVFRALTQCRADIPWWRGGKPKVFYGFLEGV